MLLITPVTATMRPPSSERTASTSACLMKSACDLLSPWLPVSKKA